MKIRAQSLPKEVKILSKLLKHYGVIPKRIWHARGGYGDGGENYRFDFSDGAVLILNIKNKKVSSIGFEYGNSKRYHRIGSMLKFYESKHEWPWRGYIRISFGDLTEGKRLPRSELLLRGQSASLKK
ncbi:MAG TPA: hypothetical protein VIH04_05545 [Nitrosarchaeum sp.]